MYKSSNMRSATSAGRHTLVIAPSGWWGSVGDDALLRGACKTLLGRGGKVLVLSGEDCEKWAKALKDLGIPVYNQKDLFRLFILLATRRVKDVYVIGADIMDGGYDERAPRRRLLLANVLWRLGKRVSVVSFSFNKNPAESVLNAFSRTGRGLRYALRDRPSLVRFEQATGMKADLVADIGFLADPMYTPEVNDLLAWCEKARQAGRKTVFVNLNIGPFHKSPLTKSCSPSDIVGAMARVLRDLKEHCEHPVSVVVVPHDFREIDKPWSDVALADALLAELKPSYFDQIRIVPTPFNSGEICAMTQGADLVVTGRMHLAILSIAAGKVPASFTYQDKFEGMYEHVFASGADLMLDSHALISRPEEITMRLKEILYNQESLEAEIAAARPRIRSLAEHNF